MGCRGVNVERANHGFGLKEVPYHFVHLLVLRSMIFLRVLFGVPKAQGQDTIVLFVGDEDCLIHEIFLFLQDRQYLVIDGLGELFIFTWLGG